MTALPDPSYQPEYYASVPAKRLLAWVVDTIIVTGLTILIGIFTLGIGFILFGLIWLLLNFCYRVVTLANGSSTLGMRLMAIELREGDGRRFDLPAAFWHTVGYSVSLAFPLLQVISIVLMLTSARGQGLTDQVLGTAAINRAAL